MRSLDEQALMVAATPWRRLRGLTALPDYGGDLVIAPCKDVHTFGMRRPIDVAFVNSQGRVVKVVRRMLPFRRARCGQAVITVERYASDGVWLAEGDQLRLRPGALR